MDHHWLGLQGFIEIHTPKLVAGESESGAHRLCISTGQQYELNAVFNASNICLVSTQRVTNSANGNFVCETLDYYLQLEIDWLF